MAYDSLEPFGEERADLRSGILASVMSNRWRGKGESASQPRDYMPFAKPVIQTALEQKEALERIFKRGRVPDKTKR